MILIVIDQVLVYLTFIFIRCMVNTDEFKVEAGGIFMAFVDDADIEDSSKVEFVCSWGLLSGYPDGTFKPRGYVTRAEVVKVLAHILLGHMDASSYVNLESRFENIESYKWAKGYFMVCEKTGIFDDFNKQYNFNPKEEITIGDLLDLFNALRKYYNNIGLCLKYIENKRPRWSIEESTKVTRMDVAEMIYNFLAYISEHMGAGLREYSKNEEYEKALKYMEHFHYLLQSSDSELYYIYDLLDKPDKQNKERYKYIYRILAVRESLAVTVDEKTRIFHYTSLKALSCLCDKDSKFQMGNPAYLNDTQEGQNIKTLVKNNERCKNKLKDWEYLFDNEEMIEVSNTYIASFTNGNETDQLPMWIQYGDNGKGCRIEFCPSSIRLPLYRVIYENGVIEERIDKIINHLCEYRKVYKIKEINDNAVFAVAGEVLHQLGYMLKGTPYKHENEVRAIVLCDISKAKQADAKNENEILPRIYSEMPQHLEIASVTFGPRAENIDRDALALSYYGIPTFSQSKIPLRR